MTYVLGAYCWLPQLKPNSKLRCSDVCLSGVRLYICSSISLSLCPYSPKTSQHPKAGPIKNKWNPDLSFPYMPSIWPWTLFLQLDCTDKAWLRQNCNLTWNVSFIIICTLLYKNKVVVQQIRFNSMGLKACFSLCFRCP